MSAAAEKQPDTAARNGDLGRRLRELRTSRKLSLAEVAEATSMSPSFLSVVENGQSDITVSRLMRLVQWYGVSVSDPWAGGVTTWTDTEGPSMSLK